MISRGYANVGTDDAPQLMHYYACGVGPALLLLHPSPASAESYLPILEALGKHATAIAIDTPGYGHSDRPDRMPANLSPYVDALDRFCEQLNIGEAIVYGSATGAQIALEFSKRYPDRCASTILDNCADFPESECAAILDGYFPDLAVDYSGAHLTRIWTMALDLHRFFPWHWPDRAEARLPGRDLDPNALQLMALQYLQAGPEYDWAYRAAFANERLDNLLATKTRTTILRSAGSVLKRYTDCFDEIDWPDNFELRHCGAAPSERVQAIVDIVKERADGLPSYHIAPAPQGRGRRMVAHPLGGISATLTDRAASTWLLLHDLGSSSTAIADVTAAFARHGQVLAPDLPGHGSSDPLAADQAHYLDLCNEAIECLCAEDDLQNVRVVAFGEATAIGLHLAETHPDLVASLALIDPLWRTERPPIVPTLDGTHLLSLWHHLRNSELYYPATEPAQRTTLGGHPELRPERVNRRLIDCLQSLGSAELARTDIEQFPVREAAAACSTPVMIARTENTAAGARSSANFPDIEDIVTRHLPPGRRLTGRRYCHPLRARGVDRSPADTNTSRGEPGMDE